MQSWLAGKEKRNAYNSSLGLGVARHSIFWQDVALMPTRCMITVGVSIRNVTHKEKHSICLEELGYALRLCTSKIRTWLEHRFARICAYLLPPSSLRLSGRDEMPPHIPR